MDGRARAHLILFGLTVGGAAVALFGWRIVDLSGIDPWADQFFQFDWVRSLLAADHWLPRAAGAGGSWLAALKTDSGSVLHVLLAHVYAAHNLILTVVSVAWFGFWGWLFGGDAAAQAAIGIATHGLMVVALAWAAVVGGFGRSLNERMAVGGLAFLFAVGSPALQVYASVGFHNLALLFLVIALALGERWLAVVERGSVVWRRGLGFLTVQVLALYAYFTNVFFLPTAVLMALLTRPRGAPRRLAIAGGYALAVAVTLLPLPLLLAVTRLERGGAGSDQDFLGRIVWAFVNGDAGPDGPLTRAVQWFPHVANLFSPFGLALGLAGAVGLAVVQGRRLPLALLAAHWLAGVLVPAFYAHWSMTGVYALPMLCLGCAWAVVTAVRLVVARGGRRGGWRGMALAATLLLVAAHAAGAVEGWREPRQPPHLTMAFRRAAPLRALVAAIDARLPAGAVVIPANYQRYYLIRALSRRVGGDFTVFRPLDILDGQARAGHLAAYLAERGLAIPAGAPLFVLAATRDSPQAVARRLDDVFGPGGLGRIGADRPVTVTPAWPDAPLFRVCAGTAACPAP